MKRLRILLVLPDPPLPAPVPLATAAGRWFYVLLKGLVERGHEVTAFVSSDSVADIDATTKLFPRPAYDLRCYPRAIHQGLAGKWRTICRPYSYLFSAELQADLAAELQRGFDVLHLEQLWTGWLGLDHASRAVVNVHYLFSVDLADQPCATAGERMRRLLSRRAERRLLNAYPTILTLTRPLAEHVGRIAPRADVRTIPLGLDLSIYPFASDVYRNGRPPVVSLIGSFDWPSTRSAGERLTRELWPEIKRRVPAARLRIVGRRARAALGDFAGGPDVTIHEDVPDTRPYFAESDVLLYAPRVGSGMKVKTLEAFAMGTPVVTTRAGAEGIAAEDGIHAGVCEDDSGLIERTVALLNNAELRQRRRLAARQLVETQCAPPVVLDQLEDVYARLKPSGRGER
jgi:glycosyltransferase involved in cell wall biosynthesis